MTVKDTMDAYLLALAKHEWSDASPFFNDGCSVVFAEGTYIGKDQVRSAMTKTFSLIRDESFDVTDINWNFVNSNCAGCTFIFSWAGTLSGQRFLNKGRGTLVWAKIYDQWQIINKHLGPLPK